MSVSHYKYLILGAGPSGLSFAHTLLKRGEESFLVIEKEAEAGGLCRSEMVDGTELDIGGGHFLDVRRQDTLEMVFRFMPESEWARFSRVAKIRLCGVEVDHPLEGNLWQLPIQAQVDYLESIARAGCLQGEPMPELFEDWIRWKLGQRIAEDYMLPYNRKVWRRPLNDLGTYWLYKLPDVSFRETLLSCLSRNAKWALPAHGEFLYPRKYGYGEVWRRMGTALGERLLLNTALEDVDISSRKVNHRFTADTIVNTIPWTVWAQIANLPPEIAAAVSKLAYVPIDVDYRAENVPGNAHWIYEPAESFTYHRILCRSNFCTGARGYWTETNASASPAPTGFRHRNEFAYPVNTAGKPEAVETISRWANSANILPLGRWGTWEHMNSDVAVSQAISAAEQALKNSR